MANIINGTDSGQGGLITTGDSSDELQLQTAETARVTLTNTAVVVNEDGNDVDFRVEGDTDANLLFVDASADAVGIGTSSPSGKLGIQGASGQNAYIECGGNGNTLGGTSALFGQNDSSIAYCWNRANAALLFGTNGSERMRIDSSGNVLVGTTANNALWFNTTIYGNRFLIEQNGAPANASYVTQGLVRNSNDSESSILAFGKSRGTTAGSATVVSSGDSLATLSFQGADGTNLVEAARIAAVVDGTPGANDMPGRLVFFTTPDGSASPTERMRIDSSGRLLVGTTGLTNNGTRMSVSGANRVVRILGSTEGEGAFMVDKTTNTSTTSQVFIQFSINDQATANGQINANGASQAAFGSFSDQRLKENIVDLPPQLANICALRPVEFDYIESEGGGHQIGFVAQNVQEIYPDLVGERSDGMLTLSGLNKNEARLVKAIQELKAELDEAKARIAALENA